MSRTLPVLRSLAIALTWLVLTGCGGVISGAETADDSGAGSEEAGLFEDGPIDLPVTIAKLESPNPLNITIEFSDTGTANLFTSSATQTATFTGAGDADDEDGRAIHDPSATPYVLVYNSVTGEQNIVEVAADGSFSAQIAADTQQSLGLYALTAADTGIASASPGVYYVKDSLGTITVTVSNSDAINDDMPFSIAPNGSLLFSVNGDNGYELWRRNIDGSLPDRLLTDHVDSILFAASVSTDQVGDLQNIFTLDRGVDLFIRMNVEDGEVEDDITNWTTLIDGLGTIEASEDNQSTQSFAMTFLDANRILLKSPADDSSEKLEVVDTDGNRVTVIDASQGYGPTQPTKIRFGLDNQVHQAYVAMKDGSSQQTQIYRLDLMNDTGVGSDGAAWQDRATVLLTTDFEVLSLAQDNQNNAILLAQHSQTDVIKLLYLTQGGGLIELANLSTQGIAPAARMVYLSSPEEFNGVALCEETSETSARLFYYSIDMQVSDGQAYDIEPTQLTSNEELRSCRHLEKNRINDSQVVLSFFTQPSADGASQLSFLPINGEILGQ